MIPKHLEFYSVDTSIWVDGRYLFDSKHQYTKGEMRTFADLLNEIVEKAYQTEPQKYYYYYYYVSDERGPDWCVVGPDEKTVATKIRDLDQAQKLVAELNELLERSRYDS